MSRKDQAREWDNAADEWPPAGELVWVKCEGFRCLAFRDQNGKWWDIHNDEMPPDIRIVRAD